MRMGINYSGREHKKEEDQVKGVILKALYSGENNEGGIKHN